MNTDAYIWLILLGSITSSIFFLKRAKPLYLKVLPLYLLVTFIVEFVGAWLNDHGETTTTLFNIFTTVEFVFYFWMLRYILHNNVARKILLHSLWVYPILVILNKLFLQKGVQFHTITVSLGCLLIVMATITYFFELFQSNKSVKLVREPAFWICSGLLFYYACSFPLYALTNFLYTPSTIIIKIVMTIFAIVNILLYSSFIVASLCQIRIRKSYS